jgi:hypothetical protein
MKKAKKVMTKKSVAKRPATGKPETSKSSAKRPVALNDRPAPRKTWQPPGEPVGLGWPAFRYPPG